MSGQMVDSTVSARFHSGRVAAGPTHVAPPRGHGHARPARWTPSRARHEPPARRAHRRGADLVGRVRGARLGVAVRRRHRARRRCARLGLAATEFGPDGLPARGAGSPRAKVLADHGLHAVGGFVPVVLHDPAHDPVPGRPGHARGLRRDGRAHAGARRGDRAGGVRRTPGPGRDGLVDPAAQPRPAGRRPRRSGASRRPCTRTSARWSRTPARCSGCSTTAAIGLCLDTGHLLIGGADPVALARDHAARSRHVHLKDVDAGWAARVRSGEVGYTEAVRQGMYRPLGQGDVDIAAIVGCAGGGRLRRVVRPRAGHHPPGSARPARPRSRWPTSAPASRTC